MAIERTIDQWTPAKGRVIETKTALVISDVIAALEAIKAEHGDLDVIRRYRVRYTDGESAIEPVWGTEGELFDVVDDVYYGEATNFGDSPLKGVTRLQFEVVD